MVRVHLKDRSYDIISGRGLLARAGRECVRAGAGSDALCVTNSGIRERYGKKLSRSFTEAGLSLRFCAIPDGERSKSFAVFRKVLAELAGMDSLRRPFVVALGGGVVGDLAGFCSAVYKRGIPYVQIPTTLLAQIDSAIGGKTAIDLPEGKNLVGAFHQPRLVLSDIDLLSSLSDRQFNSGMAEAVKYGLISDPKLFSLLEENGSSLRGKPQALKAVVEKCAGIKARIVEKDERESRGIRVILNFGHTVGHAVEAGAGYGRYTHGEAISFGMACACDISVRSGILPAAQARRVELCLGRIGLPVRLRGLSFSDIIGPYKRDKKFSGKSRLVLLKRIGEARVVEDVPLETVKAVVMSRMDK